MFLEGNMHTKALVMTHDLRTFYDVHKIFEEIINSGLLCTAASILHLPYDELISVLNKVARSLKEEGLLDTCFKYGTEEGIRNGR